ncbi:MAG TPA: M14 family metallopeptidase, partial [Polyangiaceae bacterium]|nr:M14 family metallopeptidase [Polyangiaceae bacterium]
MSQPTELRTVAEQSGFRKTGRYEEVLRLVEAYARTWPDAVRSFEFGRTPEGRPMVALAVSRSGALTPEDVRQRKIPVLFLQGGIHPGESDGKDAGFLWLRDVLEGRDAKGVLERSCILFVPVFNVDGHERFGRWNRPNQIGPEEMGWRTTSQNYNLNRDYVKADAPEMRAMLRLLNAWDPVMYADLHVTDGADFEHDVSIQVEPIHFGDPALQATGKEIRDEVLAKLSERGSLPLPFYPSFARADDPAAGFEGHVYTPRFSTGYWALRNRWTLLLETHSWKDYATRVRVTVNTIRALAEWTAAKGADALARAREVEARAAHLGGENVVVAHALGAETTLVDFRGYAYTREPSAISGALFTRYDTSKPTLWRVPLRDVIEPKYTIAAPKGGYIVPAAHAEEIGAKLTLHQIEFRQLDAAAERVQVDTFRATQVTIEPKPFEGRTMVALEGAWRPEPRDIPAGSLFVPIAQGRARLLMALFEPKASDSFVAWGFFNAI